MNFASRGRRKPTFYSPVKKSYLKLPQETIQPLQPLLFDSPLRNKPFVINLNPTFIRKRLKYLRSLSCESFDLSLYQDQKNFERRLISVKNTCNIELDSLLQELTENCLLEAQSEPQTRAFLKVFFSIYVEFQDLNIETFKEEDIRRLFTLIDSSKKSLLNPGLSYQEFREYWIIREENFFKSDLTLKGFQFKAKILRVAYLKFQFLMTKISRLLEIKYIVDEDFKDLIKKPNHSFVLKKAPKISSIELPAATPGIHSQTARDNDDMEQKLKEFLVLRVNYWTEMVIEQATEENPKQPSLTCKICLREFPLEQLKGHSYRCKELAELNQDMIELKKEFNKAESYSKELMRKIFLENQLERNGLKKLRAKAKYEERSSEPYALSAMIKKPKLRSMTYTNEQVMVKHPPSPSIFKRQNNENLTIVVMPCDANLNLKDKMNCSIRNFIAKPQKELVKTNSNSSEKAFEETTNLRNKMLTKHNKIKNNEMIIGLLTKIRNISMEVSKTQFTPKIELKLDDLKKGLKNRPNIPSYSKYSTESFKFLNEFFQLLENYNHHGHKILLLSKEEKHLINSPEKRLKRSGTRISDDELRLTSKKDSASPKKRSGRESSFKEKSIEMTASAFLNNVSVGFSQNFVPEMIEDSCKENRLNTTNSRDLSYDIEESPIKHTSDWHYGQKDSFIESHDSSSNIMENDRSSPNVFSFKTKAFNESSDDEKSVSINLSSVSPNQNVSSEEENQEEDSSPEKEDRRCFSDSASNVRGTNDLFNEKKNAEIGIHDFDFVKMINKGAFGRVWMVKRKQTGDVYAMKVINCLDNMNKNKLDSLKAESEVFDRIYNEFVVKSYFRFTHETFICFVMEYMYGDFAQILKSYGCFEEGIARFYIAELILAVEHLHALNIIHRDLKPDNILIDAKGHIRLTDFGLSDICMKMYKQTKRKTFIGEEQMGDFANEVDPIRPLAQLNSNIAYVSKTEPKVTKLKTKLSIAKGHNKIVGTPDYIAPEILCDIQLDDDHITGPSMDWWSIGVILFEFLTGIPPFNDDEIEKIFQNIINHRIPWDQLEIGNEEGQITQEAFDLINRLLNPNPELRLGTRSVDDIKKHPFFKDFNWNEVKNQIPPILPEIKSPKIDSKDFKEPFTVKNEAKNDLQMLETKKMLTKNMNTFTQTRYDLLNLENLKNIQKIKRKLGKMHSKEGV